MPLSIKEAVRTVAQTLVPDSTTFPILKGPARGLRVPKELALAYPSAILGNYESGLVKAIQTIQRPVKIIYDIGAHVGLTSLTLAGVYGRDVSILAFEPVQENLSSLNSVRSANPGADIRLYPLALSDTVGQVEFCSWQGSSMGLLRTIAAENGSSLETSYTVRSMTLDAGVFQENWPRPDVIKIDVEGAEYLVLSGGQKTLRKYHPVLVLELHGPQHAAEVFDLLAQFQYSWTYIKPNVGPSERIMSKAQLSAYFGRDDRWTQHVILQESR
jgi:FkbM family methyltransferase